MSVCTVVRGQPQVLVLAFLLFAAACTRLTGPWYSGMLLVLPPISALELWDSSLLLPCLAFPWPLGLLTEALSLAQQAFYLLSHLSSPLLILAALCEGTGTLKPPSSHAALCTWSPCLSGPSPLKLVLHSGRVSFRKVLVMPALCLASYPFQSWFRCCPPTVGGPAPHLTDPLGAAPFASILCTASQVCAFSLLLQCEFLFSGFFTVIYDCPNSFRFLEKLWI